MRLVITGIEYSGKSSLGEALCEWIRTTMGQEETGTHDHYWPNISHQDLTDEEQKYLLGLSPRLKELVMRNTSDYHVQHSFYGPSEPDHIVIGAHIEDAVMGPFYYGYGSSDDIQARSTIVNPILEAEILRNGPDTVLVHLKASVDVIRQRMNDSPHPNSVLQGKDVPIILGRFEEEVAGSKLGQRIVIDTSGKTVEQTLNEFVQELEPYLTDIDRQRILIQKFKRKGEWI